jgi:hypothetical protein
MKEDKRSAAVLAHPAMTLSIIFQGPLVFDFGIISANGANPTVDVYAPYCPYHEAGFFYEDFSYSETDLWLAANGGVSPTPSGGLARAYTIQGSGITACTGAPTQLNPVRPPTVLGRISNDPVLKPVPSDKAQVVPEKILFRTTVPRPWLIYPLYCDSVEVVKGFSTTPQGNLLACATGLRFLYPWVVGSDIYLYPPGTKPPVTTTGAKDITPPAGNDLPDHGSIDVRYQGLEIQDRNDTHSDARSCFASVATLAGVTEWWLNYGDGMTSPTNPSKPSKLPQPRSHTAGDCGAPAIVLGLPAITTS